MIVQEFRAQLLRNRRTPVPFSGPVFACLGNFDGIHLGHQSLIERVKQAASQDGPGATMLISFYPHPSMVLGNNGTLPRLVSLRQSLRVLGQHRIDYLYLIHFTRALSQYSAERFIEELLFERLKVRYLAVGADASVGYKRQGNPAFIQEYFRRAGRRAEVVPYVTSENERVSSGAVRRLLRDGLVSQAARLLGRPYAIEGRVVPGAGRGSALGFGTANLRTKQFLPKFGVYASRVEIHGRRYWGVTNIGIRPTFREQLPSVETHLPGWGGEPLYRARLDLQLIERIRDELRFPSAQALASQISADIRTAKSVLGED